MQLTEKDVVMNHVLQTARNQVDASFKGKDLKGLGIVAEFSGEIFEEVKKYYGYLQNKATEKGVSVELSILPNHLIVTKM